MKELTIILPLIVSCSGDLVTVLFLRVRSGAAMLALFLAVLLRQY